VGQWLSGLGLTDYESLFVNYGFDDLEFIVSRHAFHAATIAIVDDTRRID